MSELQNTNGEEFEIGSATRPSKPNLDGEASGIADDVRRAVDEAQRENNEAYADAILAINRGLDPKREHESTFTTRDMAELRGRLDNEERQRNARERLAQHGAEIVASAPSSVRLDESTGEPILPLIYIPGLGGDGKLPYHVKRLAETGQRQVVALSYGGRLGTERNERIETEGGDVISGVYQDRAEDLELLVDALALDRVEVAAQSVGAPTAVLLADARPNQVNRLGLFQPEGVDMMSPRQRKIAAARELLNYLPGTARNKDIVKEQKPEEQQMKTHIGLLGRLRNMQQQRRDIFSTRIGETIAGLDPRIQVAITADLHDDVYPADEIYRATSKLPHNVRFVATDWKRGKHAIGYSERAIEGVAATFLEMERVQRDGTW